MPPDVKLAIPPLLNEQFREFDKNCSKKEAELIDSDFKKRLQITPTSKEVNLSRTFEELFRSGKVTQVDNSILKIAAEKCQNKNQIISSLDDLQRRSLPPKKDAFLGRNDEKQELLKLLSDQNIHGMNLYGISGVGKTTIAKEVAKEFTADLWEEFTFDLRGLNDIGTTYVSILSQFGLTSLFKNAHEMQEANNLLEVERVRILEYLKTKCMESKIILIFDNVETEIIESHRDEFDSFLNAITESEACKNGMLKIILTSLPGISVNSIRNHCVKPLPISTCNDFICRGSKRDLYGEEFKVDEVTALSKVAEYCRKIPYLLEGAEHILRNGFITPDVLLHRIETQKEQGVPENYFITGAVFQSISTDNLRELAVKVCAFRRPFSASAATKIAELKSEYDALLDLEYLTKHRLVQKVETGDGKTKYDVHSLFKEFVSSYLNVKFTNYEEAYSRAEMKFGQHYVGKMLTLSNTLVQDFTGTFLKIQKNKLNFDVALLLTFTKGEILEQLIPLPHHETICRITMLLESLKSINERKVFFAAWADALERKGDLLTSAHMRCWESIQLADMEGTAPSERILHNAEICFNQTSGPKNPTNPEFTSVKGLLFYCKGKLNYMKSVSKKDMKTKSELIEKARQEYHIALTIHNDIYGDHIMTVRTLNGIGNCYMEYGQPETAEGFYTQALEMTLRLTKDSEQHIEIPTFYNQLSQVYQKLGDQENKKFSFKRVLLGKNNSTKAKQNYEKAVSTLKKAVKLNEDLGLDDTLSTATFNRNLANVLIALERYDEALGCAKLCYELRNKILGNHPETVRIFYLMGVINEWRKDTRAALLSYEDAFKMEEQLPIENHSVMKGNVCDRLEQMCKKCNEKKKLQEYAARIKQLREIDKDTERKRKGLESKQEFIFKEDVLPLDAGFPFDGEFNINVTQQGGTYNHSINGFVLSFPPNCVSEPTRIKYETKPTLPSPANSNEHLVSSVVRLGPNSLQLALPFVLTMLHCGPSEKKGYETIVKVLNEESQVWQEKEELQQASPSPENIRTQYVEVQLTKLTAVAVVTRLFADTFEVPVSGCVVRSSVDHHVTVRFPEGAVNRTIKGALKVLRIPDHRISNTEYAVPCPVLLFSGFKGVVFSKPVCINVPMLSQSEADEVRLLRLDDTKNPPFLWEDITKGAELKQHGNSVELQVKQFCGYWLWRSPNDVLYKAYDLYKYLVRFPCQVSFAGYQQKQSSDSSKFEVKLTCVAITKQQELTKYLDEKMGYKCLETITASEEMREKEKAYPFVEGIEEKHLTKDFFLQFFEQAPCQKVFEMNTALRKVKLTFSRDPKKCDHKLCVLPLKKAEEIVLPSEKPGNNVFDGGKNATIWVEYCGIEFTPLRELPEEIVGGLTPCFTGYDKLKDTIDGYMGGWYTNDGVENFLSLLPQVPFDQVEKKLGELECFKTNRHFADLLMMLQYGHNLVDLSTLDNIPDEVRQTIKDISKEISIKHVEFGRKLGLSEELLNDLKSSSEVLTYWSNNCRTSKLADLFKALRACWCKEPAVKLAKTITHLAKAEVKEKDQTQESHA